MIEALDRIDALVRERHLLKHPFYRAWQEGTLSPAAMKSYAAQYYLHVRAFPTYISALHARCDDIETRKTLLANLRDEEEGPADHPSLWRRFAAAVGCDPAVLDATVPLPETAAAIEAFRRAVGEGPLARGLAALHAYESMVPEVAAEKIKGLTEHYGVHDSPGTDYFEVHATLDVEHAAETRALLEARLAAHPEEAGDAERGAVMALDAVNGLLSGICRTEGIARAA